MLMDGKLLFSFDKEFKVSKNNAGKVWRVFVRNGILRVGDGIQITSVNLESQPKASFYTVDAIVKSIREDHDVSVEGIKEASQASKGSIVGLDIKNCYADGRAISKKEIVVTKQSYGLAAGEKFNHYDSFYIKFTDVEKAFDVIKFDQDIVLLWFGQGISTKLVSIPDSMEGMYVRILNNKKLAIPSDIEFRNSELIRRIVICVEHKGRQRFISGYFEFDS